MNTGNTKVGNETYISQPVSAVWQAFLRWKNTNLATTVLLAVLTILVFVMAFIAVIVIVATNAFAANALSNGDWVQLLNWFTQYGWVAILLAVVGIILLTLPFSIAIDYTLVSSQNDRKVGVGTALKRGYSRLFVGLGTYLLAGLMILGGLVLLIAPGIYIALRLGYINSIVANENLGVMDNIRRSFALTKNNLWDMIGVGSTNLIVTSVFGILMGITALALGLNDGASGADSAVITVLSLAAFAASVVTAFGIYLRYHQSALEKESKLTKTGTDKLNYILFALAVLLSIGDNSLSDNSKTPDSFDY